jgi:hypothetical protein
MEHDVLHAIQTVISVQGTKLWAKLASATLIAN